MERGGILCTYAYDMRTGINHASEIFMTMQKIDWKAAGRRLRELRGFDSKQADFARQLGISQGQLSRYEKGKSEIGAEVLLRISQRFGKSIEWLLTGKT